MQPHIKRFWSVKRIQTALYVSAVLLLVLLSSGTLSGFEIGNNRIYVVTMLLEACYVVTCSGRIVLHRGVQYGLILSVILLLVQMAVYWRAVPYLIRFMAIFFFHFIFIWEASGNIDLVDAFEHIVRILLLINLVMYFGSGMFHLIEPSNPSYMTQFGIYQNYYGLYFHRDTFFVRGIPRNTGLYWEPGLWQVFLNAGLAAYFVRHEKRKISIRLLYVAGILSTVSTTGILVMFVILFYYEFLASAKRYRRAAGAVLIFVFAATALVLLAVKKNMYAESYHVRMNDVTVSLKLMLKYPFFGSGYMNDAPYQLLLTDRSGNTNGILEWIYETGLPGTAFLVLPYAGLLRRQSKQRMQVLVLVFIYVMVNASEPMFSFSFNILILAFVYAEYCKVRKKTGYQRYRPGDAEYEAEG